MKQAKKNFILGVIHEGFWGAGFGLFMPATILPLALVDLGRSASTAGYLSGLIILGITLPQVFSALWLPPRFTHPKLLALLHFPAISGPLVAGLGFALVPPTFPVWRLAFLFAGGILFGFGIGFVAPHWVAGIGRCIPEKIRGRYFGTSFFASGLFGSVTGWLGSRWASQGGNEWGYAVCFLTAVPFFLASVVVLIRIKPLIGPPKAPPPGILKSTLRLINHRILTPGALRVGIVLTIFLSMVSAPGNIFTVYLRKVAELDASWFQLFTPVVTLGGMGGAFFLGWLVDHKGLRPAFAATFAAGLLSLVAIFFWENPLWSTVAFAASGFIGSSFPVITLPMILKLSGRHESTVQVGLFNTLMGPWTFIGPVFFSQLAERGGYPWSFGLAALLSLAAFVVLGMDASLDVKKKNRLSKSTGQK